MVRGFTADTIKRLVIAGNYTKEDMLNKMDVFLLANRISEQEYNEILALMEQYPPKA